MVGHLAGFARVPGGWLGIAGPLTITFLILKVSGIPMLEKKMAENPNFESTKEEQTYSFRGFRKMIGWRSAEYFQ